MRKTVRGITHDTKRSRAVAQRNWSEPRLVPRSPEILYKADVGTFFVVYPCSDTIIPMSGSDVLDWMAEGKFELLCEETFDFMPSPSQR